MAITINGSGTITGVSAGGLPDGSVDADTLASTLDLSGKTMTYGLTDSDLSGLSTGKILQIVEQTSVSETSTNTGSYVDSGFDKSITPTSSSSKILLILNTTAAAYRGGSGYYRGYTRFQRNGSNIGTEGFFGGYLNVGSDNNWYGIHTQIYLDSPSTTSSTRYQVQVKSNYASTSATIGVNSTHNRFYLVEIAG